MTGDMRKEWVSKKLIILVDVIWLCLRTIQFQAYL